MNDQYQMISIDRYNKPSIGRRNINPNVFEKSNSIELRDENSQYNKDLTL